MKNIIILLFLSLNFHVFGQFSINGKIYNEAGEKLDAAVVFLENTNFSVISDPKGNYSFENIPEGEYTLIATFLGYKNHTINLQVEQDLILDIIIKGNLYELDEIEVISNRIKENNPFTYSTISKEQISKENLGQDIPFLINKTPSTVATSDAGAGIGYTGIRIRGNDQSRINVTVNGIPINDAESQDVFWVNMPDISRSTEEIQIQRGVGPSTNGAGSYGGSIGLNTLGSRINPYIEVDGTYGSFNTRKISANLGTGLMNNKYSIEARYSLIKSDGYIDRATSGLSSYYLAASSVTSNSSLRFITFSGKERTYQSWYGTPQSKIKGSDEELKNHYNNNIGSIYKTVQDSINLFESDRRYNYYLYDNQVDDYQQSHYQLHYAKQLSNKLSYKAAAYYTKGKGYFEEYKTNDLLSSYNLTDYVVDSVVITNADIVRRRWLDNDLFGALLNVTYDLNPNIKLTTGGLISKYIGDHYGNIDTVYVNVYYDPLVKYYSNRSDKLDANLFSKLETKLTSNLWAYGDLQWRYVNYKASGIDNDNKQVNVKESYSFLNPKLGLKNNFKNGSVYASFGIANREPDRSDFLDNPKSGIPTAETLFDYELGAKFNTKPINIGATLYFMDYKDQLIQTGDLNDVGSALRVNVPESYRLGLELEYQQRFSDWLIWNWNLSLSKNKIKNFTEVLFDYTDSLERVEIEHEDVDIAFSPSIIYSNQFNFKLLKNLWLGLETKYVGKQYLDNTQSEQRKLDPYLFNNLRLNYKVPQDLLNSLEVKLAINNILNSSYSANGYTYSYFYNELITENFEYPQAGINFLLGVSVKF